MTELHDVFRRVAKQQNEHKRHRNRNSTSILSRFTTIFSITGSLTICGVIWRGYLGGAIFLVIGAALSWIVVKATESFICDLPEDAE